MPGILTLQNGRYEQRTPWKPIPGGQGALFWDTHLDKEVLVRDLPRYRYVEEPLLFDRDGSHLRSLVEHNARVDAFFQKMKLICEKVGSIAQTHGVVTETVDYLCEGTQVYRISELIKSENWMADEVKDHLSVVQIDALMQRLSMMVAALHSAGVIHCHLAPPGIRIVKEPDGEYRGVLGNLEDSFLKDAGPGEDIALSMEEYAPPELVCAAFCEGEPDIPLYEPLDVFALGLIYHVYLTGGLPPFDSERYVHLFESLLNGEPLQLSPKLTLAHRLLLNRMLTALPYDRLQDCAEVAEAIEQIRRRYDAEFRMTVRSGGEPLANKEISLWAHFKSPAEMAERQSVCLYKGRTDAKGQVVFTGLTDAEYTLRADDVELPIAWEQIDENRFDSSVQIETA